MTDPTTVPIVLVVAQQTSPPSLVGSFWPLAVMLLIFYVLVLLPMQRRQKKVREFQSGLKVGDRVITTSGIYGQITKLNEASVQLQVADRVRIEVARASIGGYQGKEPVVQDSATT